MMTSPRKHTITVVFILLAILVLVLPASAQDERVVTDDEVNAIAGKMYCPVCENIPLDTCGTAACSDWREEIRSYLESGMTEDEVINEFVTRYGDRVVGTPVDPTLRALSLVTPWILGAIIVLGAIWTFMRWRTGQATVPAQPVVPTASPTSEVRDEDYYRSRLEQDLQSKR